MKLTRLSAYTLSAVSPLILAQEKQPLLEEVYVFGQKYTDAGDAGSRLGLSSRKYPRPLMLSMVTPFVIAVTSLC